MLPLEVYLESTQTSMMELFVKVVKSWNPLTISSLKSSIIEVRLHHKYCTPLSKTGLAVIEFCVREPEIFWTKKKILTLPAINPFTQKIIS